MQRLMMLFRLQPLRQVYTFNADQRAIGADWRDVITRVVFNDVFFVLKDASGNYYKIKFISLLNANGERGYPVFQYALLK